MLRRALTPNVLMNFSEFRIDAIRRSATSDDGSVVKRLFDSPVTYRRWQSFHFDLMKNVAASNTRGEQRVRIRETSFRLIHRQALFEHLRESRVRGRERAVIFAALHRSTDYARAVVAEHSQFLQSNSSLFCTDYIESSILEDTNFSDELSKYREMYQEYFSLYCGWIIAEDRGSEYPLVQLIRAMKRELLEERVRLLAMPNAAHRLL
jgi:hypothetical protein